MCVSPRWKWCPDAAATDGGHRFCVKSESDAYGAILNVEKWSLQYGIPFRFAIGEGMPLNTVTEQTFAAHKPYLAPIAGYQQKAFVTDDDALRVVYLRNTELVPSLTEDETGLMQEAFSMRRQKAVPVTIEGIDPSYRVTLYDLETRCMTEIDPAEPMGLGVTDHDFILMMERR